jgi:D-alanine-D-alanine ligase
MPLCIGFAYNEKPVAEEEPPATGSHDRYAEWDDPATIDAVAAALEQAGTVIRLEADADFPLRLRDARPQIVFNIAEGLHGASREAQVPAFCEYFDIPYTGSDPLSLALALDKCRAKEIFMARGVPTPAFQVVSTLAHPLPAGAGGPAGRPELALDFPLPALVKPLYEGSSKGIPAHAYCTTEEAVTRRVAEVLAEYEQPALVEAFLPGREFTCAILGNGAAARALPLVEVLFSALPAGAPPIYGYEAKWLWDTTAAPLEIFACPAAVEPALERAIEATALAAFHALGCRDWGRVDLRLDAEGRPQVIEINPLPGILPDPRQNSCFPTAARAAGLGYDDLILGVLETALERYGIRP